MAADEERVEPEAAPQHERADAGWPADLVAADRDEIGVEGRQIDRRVPDRGRRVDVDQDAGRPGQPDDLVDGLDGPDLVVGPLAVHEGRRVVGVPPEGIGDAVDVDPAVAVDRELLDRGQPAGGVADGRMLDVGAEDDTVRPLSAGTPDGGVDRLGGPGREDHLAGPHAEQAGDLLPGLLDGYPHGPRVVVDPSGVGERAGQPLPQRVDHLRSGR